MSQLCLLSFSSPLIKFNTSLWDIVCYLPNQPFCFHIFPHLIHFQPCHTSWLSKSDYIIPPLKSVQCFVLFFSLGVKISKFLNTAFKSFRIHFQLAFSFWPQVIFPNILHAELAVSPQIFINSFSLWLNLFHLAELSFLFDCLVVHHLSFNHS